MKKMISCLLALVCLLTVSFGVSAANVDFVPSISNKGAPEITIIGDLIGGDGVVINEHDDHTIIVTPVAEADTSDKIPDDAKQNLKDAYDQLNDPDTKLSDLVPDLNDIVKNALGDAKDADDLVVRDLFDVSAFCDDVNIHLPKDGTSLDLTFDLALGSNDFVTAMVYVDGKWKPIKTVNNKNGTVTATFDEFGAVAFMVPESEYAGGIPQTGDDSLRSLLLWGGVMMLSAGAIVTLVATRRKRDAE